MFPFAVRKHQKRKNFITIFHWNNPTQLFNKFCITWMLVCANIKHLQKNSSDSKLITRNKLFTGQKLSVEKQKIPWTKEKYGSHSSQLRAGLTKNSSKYWEPCSDPPFFLVEGLAQVLHKNVRAASTLAGLKESVF